MRTTAFRTFAATAALGISLVAGSALAQVPPPSGAPLPGGPVTPAPPDGPEHAAADARPAAIADDSSARPGSSRPRDAAGRSIGRVSAEPGPGRALDHAGHRSTLHAVHQPVACSR